MLSILARIRNRFSSLRHKKHASHVAFIAFAIVFVFASVFSTNTSVFAATYNFVQSSWAGGLDGGVVATHAANQSNWTQYATSTGLTMGTTVQIPSTNYTFTDDGATSTSPSIAAYGGGFANGTSITTVSFTDGGATSTTATTPTYGGGFANGTNSSTAVSGTGSGAGIGLATTTASPVVTTFNLSGNYTAPAGITSVQVLVVGGGGASGSAPSSVNAIGGGGGGGAVVYNAAFAVTPGNSYPVTVGAGGATAGASGGSSAFSSITAAGGAGGGAAASNGATQGSGGNSGNGNAGSAPPNLSPSSSYYSGGGGGAGVASPGLAGGNGAASSISGTSTYYGGGGGGGNMDSPPNIGGAGGLGGGGDGDGTSGTPGGSVTGTGIGGDCNNAAAPNFGGGGGGDSSVCANVYGFLGKGGSGVVIVSSYLAPHLSGTFTSAVIDTGASNTLSSLSYTDTLPTGTAMTVDVRAGNTATPDGTWTGWQTSVASGGDISALGSQRYVQYRANLSTTNTASTPTLNSLTVSWTSPVANDIIGSGTGASVGLPGTHTYVLTALATPTIATGAIPQDITISADGTSVYVPNYGDGTVSMYSRNTTTGALTALSPATIAAVSSSDGVAVSPDGTSVYAIAYSTGNTVSMYSRNTTTGALTALSPATIAAGGGSRKNHNLSRRHLGLCDEL